MATGLPPSPTNGQQLILYRIGQVEKLIREDRQQVRADGMLRDKRIAELEKAVIRINSRLTLFQAAQGVYTSVAAILAGIFGRAL